jgi:tRNA (cytosine38-C5)-methyltransferase
MHKIFDAAKPFSTKRREYKKEESDQKLIKLDEKSIQQLEENRVKFLTILNELQLRYFTPIEIAKLLGFPVDINERNGLTFFPPDFAANSVQAYRVLGNSLSVTTVSFLASLLFLQP